MNLSTALRIKEAALRQFALNGYEATSLDSIAREVGIKKQSIYGHFQNKEQLCIQIFEEAVASEIRFLDQFFNEKQAASLEETLYDFILVYKERYESVLHMRLFLYLGFLIPHSLHDAINGHVSRYVSHKRKAVLDRISREAGVTLSVDPETAMNAYMNLIEGMFVELVYVGSKHYEKRLTCSWSIFWRGLCK
ncbi:TetR/AcrR family transcriptional regulator [Paenibacillus sp. y28]|uniref:TetR/AcrR family transcriptional regulator n=1 Tax=Paenibacillus sp. y28 TaxID=3129110 RepID=UPI003016BB1B